MKRFLFLLASILQLIACAKDNEVILSCSTTNCFVTVPFSVNIEFTTDSFSEPNRNILPYTRNYPPEFVSPLFGGQHQRLDVDVLEKPSAKNGNKWRFSSNLPITADKVGELAIGPIEVIVPVRGQVTFFGDVLEAIRIKSKPFTVVVRDAPKEGRPDSWCGAISSTLTAVASVDNQVCTAGDPIMYTLDISNAGDLRRVFPPALQSMLGKSLKVDESSLKSETVGDRKRFTWRVRALKPGTLEIPSIAVSYFNVSTMKYESAHTESIPLQIKAGVQASLGSVDVADSEVETYPMPDGLDTSIAGAEGVPLFPHLALSLTLLSLPPLFYIVLLVMRSASPKMAKRFVEHRRESVLLKFRKSLAGKVTRKDIVRFITARYGMDGRSVTAVDVRRIMAGDLNDGEIAKVEEALARADAVYAEKKMGYASLVLFALLGFVGTCYALDEGRAFSYRRALSLATQASKPAEFKAAAEAFGECERNGAASAEFYCNLGAVKYFADDFTGAISAYEKAERWSGETSSTHRGLLAATAKLKANARAELPVMRTVLKFFYRLSWDEILLIASSVWVLIWIVRILMLLKVAFSRRAAVLIFALCCARAYAADPTVTMSFDPAVTVPNVDVSIVFSVETDRGSSIDIQQLRGLPDATSAPVEYLDFERLGDGEGKDGTVVHRFRQKARFTEPYTNEMQAVVYGMKTVSVKRLGFSSTSSRSFYAKTNKAKITVVALPGEGRPKDYSGAVGSDFRLVEKVSSKDVRPNDLITVTYSLMWNGFYPTNRIPVITGIASDMKVYPPKEVSRTEHSAEWSQVMIPLNVNATNTPIAEVGYYDIARGKYASVSAGPIRLNFVDDKAASTSNTSVLIAGSDDKKSASSTNAVQTAIRVHFAPSVHSPVIAVLPHDTPVEVLDRNADGSWERVKAPSIIGWRRK